MRDLETPRAYVPFSLAAAQRPLNIQKNSNNKNSELDFILVNFLLTLFPCLPPDPELPFGPCSGIQRVDLKKD